MNAEYSVWLLDAATGGPLALVDEYAFLNYNKVVNNVGAFSIGLPDSFNWSLIREDVRVAVWRKPDGGTKALDFVGLVRYMERSQRGDAIVRTISGPDLNDFLRRRIVAYAAGTGQAEKSGYADDVMKAVVRENMGSSATDTARDLSDYGFTVQADLSDGTDIDKAFAWRNVLDALKEIADDSHLTEATSVYFGIVPLNNGWECEFRTRTGQWGNDHRFPNGAAGPVIFSLEFGNIDTVTRNLNYREEANYVYAGGQGEGTDRVIEEAWYSPQLIVSPFNRCEVFADARNCSDTMQVQAEAYAALQDGKPRSAFSGTIVQSDATRYGTEYGHGDYVTAYYLDEQIDCRIAVVSIQVAGASESLTIQLKEEP